MQVGLRSPSVLQLRAIQVYSGTLETVMLLGISMKCHRARSKRSGFQWLSFTSNLPL